MCNWFVPRLHTPPRKLKQQQVRAKRMFLESSRREHLHLGPFKDEHGNGRFLGRSK